MIRGSQRKIAARVARAYRTVAYGVVTVLAGIIPAEFLAEMHAEVYERQRVLRNARRRITAEMLRGIKIEARNRALTKWQESIRDCGRLAGARILGALQPVLVGWVDRSYGHLSYHLTQLLTGHGCFSAFLHRIGKYDSDVCRHCDLGRDTAEHTLQVCVAWREQRQALVCPVVGLDLTLPALVRRMLERPEGWNAVAEFANAVMHRKEEAEREKEREVRLRNLSLSRAGAQLDLGSSTNRSDR